MKLLMISGDRSILRAKHGAFGYTLEEFHKHWEGIDVLCPAPGGDAPLEASPFPNVRVRGCPHGLLRFPGWAARTAARLHGAEPYGVATVHEYPPFLNGLAAHRFHRRTGVPYALEVHHVVGHPTAASPTEFIGRLMSRFWLARDAAPAAAVRVVNREMEGLLARWGVSAGKIQVVPSFYLDEALQCADPTAPKTYDVAFAGRLAANKGLENVILALAGIPGARLLVVGDGSRKAAAEELVQRLDMARRVTFTGWLAAQRDVLWAIQTARVFVMASTSEGGPRVALEAMACGMPVVATRVGVMPDVLRDGENGLFTTGDPADLRVKIAMLLADQSLRSRLAAASVDVRRRFNRTTLIAEYARFLQSLA